MGCWGVWRRCLPCRPEGQVCWAQESRGPTWPSVLSGTHWAITPSPFSFPGVTASFLARSSPPTSGLLDLPWTFASLSGRHSHSITLSPCAYQPGCSTNTIPCWIPKVSAGWWERVSGLGTIVLPVSTSRLTTPFLVCLSTAPSVFPSPLCLGFPILCSFSRSRLYNYAWTWTLLHPHFRYKNTEVWRVWVTCQRREAGHWRLLPSARSERR